MEKSASIRKNYWAVMQDRKVLFDGSFNQCWEHFTTHYKDRTLSELDALHIFIGRIN